MIDIERIKKAVLCLDQYMIKQGKEEINEMEANRELERAGMLHDEVSNPGRPLRIVLSRLRDKNILPPNIKQRYGAWRIKISKTISRQEIICQF